MEILKLIKKKISVAQLESYLWESANFLRNKIDAGDYKVYLFPLMFYKRICDLYDEEYQKALDESNADEDYAHSEVNHRFQIPKGAHWNDLRQTSKNVGLKILKSMREIEKTNPDTLFGIFGDTNWGNKERLSDETLTNLIEHFSSLKLSVEQVPDDLMGVGYEFLIKKFADDSGHTAAEFYTNRTVVTLMTKLLEPKPMESIYDPTCGSGGMLLECINHLKRNKKDYRALKLFGQEKNVMTSGIARMNLLLHGFEDLQIKQGDTLLEPSFVEHDELQRFDVILANPPYSLSRWNRQAWNNDPFGRNLYGTPPQSKADFAFIQHIICSMSKKGRAAILLPTGVLFRDGEKKLREKLILDDKLEAIIGLGPDLFYNSPMDSCIALLKTIKNPERKNKVLFINAIDQVSRFGNRNILLPSMIDFICNLYEKFETYDERAYCASIDEIEKNNFQLNIPYYVKNALHYSRVKSKSKKVKTDIALSKWKNSSTELNAVLKLRLKKMMVI